MRKYKDLFMKVKGRLSTLQEQKENDEAHIDRLKNRLMSLEKAQLFIQQVAKATQEQLKFHVEDVVNLAMETLFPGEYTFSIEFNIKYGKTSADLVFTKEGFPVDILKAAGGGVVDIASLALRIAVWSFSKTDNVLILDEPVRNIQPASLQNIAWGVIKKLSHRLNLQFIVVSNSTNNGESVHLIADREYLVKKDKTLIRNEEWDVSKVEVIC